MKVQCEIERVSVVKGIMKSNYERVGLVEGTAFEDLLFCYRVLELSMREYLSASSRVSTSATRKERTYVSLVNRLQCEQFLRILPTDE